MRWTSHVLVGASFCLIFEPVATPACVLGATAPDWLEVLALHFHLFVRHRGLTHYLSFWTALAGLCLLLNVPTWIFWFSVGGLLHWLCDALTVSGAPLGWWSKYRVTLFGGRVTTGQQSEFFVTLLWVVACLAAAWLHWSGDGINGYSPYFISWSDLYAQGLIDAIEWRKHRFEFF